MGFKRDKFLGINLVCSCLGSEKITWVFSSWGIGFWFWNWFGTVVRGSVGYLLLVTWIEI